MPIRRPAARAAVARPKRSGAESRTVPSTLQPTHLDARGHAHVVDVGGKAATKRRAEALAVVVTTAEVVQAIADGRAPKGDVAALARVAGIMGAKRTAELVPLCHPLALTHVSVDVELALPGKQRGEIRLVVAAECVGPTGVEMEAMTGASVAALAVYDMIKGLDRGAAVARVELRSKSGGRSGDWRRA
jgi:cyclic pyranopterin phosphate synthase